MGQGGKSLGINFLLSAAMKTYTVGRLYGPVRLYNGTKIPQILTEHSPSIVCSLFQSMI
jgi:hypothetical protein